MTVYVLAQLSIHDPTRYARYVGDFAATLRPFEGRLLAADQQPDLIEGHARPDKVVLIEFGSRADLDAWADSEAYRAIAADRRHSTTGTVLAVHGLGTL